MRMNVANHGKVRGVAEDLNPALRSWIKDVIVPILVRDYMDDRNRKSTNQQPKHFLDSDAANVRDCTSEQVATPGDST
jgi:hypothetical protein